MSDHDPVCARWLAEYPSHFCTCTEIEEARADEREQIAQAIEALIPDEIVQRKDALRNAARVARQGGK